MTETIRNIKQSGASVLLVAHRQSALAAVDKILVLSGGAMEMFDDRDEVLRIMSERRRFAPGGAKRRPASRESSSDAGGAAS